MSKIYSQVSNVSNINNAADFSNHCSSNHLLITKFKDFKKGQDAFQDTSCLYDSIETRETQSSISYPTSALNKKSEKSAKPKIPVSNLKYVEETCPHFHPKKTNKFEQKFQKCAYNCTFQPDFSEIHSGQEESNNLTYEFKLEKKELYNESTKVIQNILDIQDHTSKETADQKSKESDFDPNTISKELLELIKAHSPDSVYTNVFTLNKRKSFFGIKKKLQEIMRYQDSSITTNSLLVLESEEESQQAVRHFSILYHQICLTKDSEESAKGIQFEKNQAQEKEQNMKILVLQYLIQFGQAKSESFINEMYTQVIKQLRNNQQTVQLFDLLNYLKCLLWSYCPSDKILLCLLHLLLIELPQQKNFVDMSVLQKQINTVIPYILRRFKESKFKRREYIGQYFLSKQLIEAIIYNNQLRIPIFFSTGSIVHISVENFDTIYDVKSKILQELKMNSPRFTEDAFIIYSIEKEKDVLNRQVSLDSEYLWDILNRWENTLCKKKIRQDDDYFQFLMIKSLLPFEMNGEDGIPILFNFSQVFYEIYTIYVNYISDKEQIVRMMSFLQNVIQDEDISKEMPLYYSEQQKKEFLTEIQKLQPMIRDQYSVIQSKKHYLTTAKHSIFYDATEISIHYSFSNQEDSYDLTSVAFKPTSFIIINKDQITYKQYWYKDIESISHSNDQKTIIKMKDGSNHLMKSDKSFQIEYLIQKFQNLLKTNQLNYFNPNKIEEIQFNQKHE